MAIPVGQYDVAPTAQAPLQIAGRWLDVLQDGWLAVALGGALLAIGIWFAHRELARRGRDVWLVRGLLALAIAGGLGLAWTQVSLLDDSFISFRYADNWAHGYGPVFNHGERVQGYTNFLWMALLTLGTAITGVAPPLVALVLGPVAFVANVLVIAALGRRLGGDVGAVPWAAVLFAVDRVATAYATTGLETLPASLLVNLGLLALLSRTDAAGAALGGLAFTAASLCRLDHGLFQAVGLAIVAWRARSPRTVAAFLTPALLLPGYLAWANWYYGEALPNTFYAKTGGGWYVEQALLYLELWALGSWAFVPLALGGVWAILRLRAPDPERIQAPFALGLLVVTGVWQVYLLRIGGDFMYGRFYLTLVPWILLAAEQAVRAAPARGWILAAALGLSVRGMPILTPGATEWFVADEPTFYRVRSLSPLTIHHHSWRIGTVLRDALAERRIRPVVATSGPGMVAYLSGLVTIDTLGLTDRAIARGPLLHRGRPGHERVASHDYLRKRGARFGNRYPPKQWEDVAWLDLGSGGGQHDWYIIGYEVALMHRIRAEAPEIGFVDFEEWLDRYVERRMLRKTPDEVWEELHWLDPYFFKINGPMRWRAAIEEYAGPR